MDQPRISIIIPTYNREKLILVALESIFKQTFQDFEVLIIDDASSDNTETVIKELNHPKVRYFKLEKNGGQCIARNIGIKKAKGEFIAFLDSDDEWLPEKLELQINCFDTGSEKLGAVYGFSYQKDVIKDESILCDTGYFRGEIRDRLFQGFCPPTPSLFMVKSSAIEQVNGFDEKLITFVDLDIWMRISETYEFDYVEQPVIIKYEQIGDQYINNFDKRYAGFGLFIKKWEEKLRDTVGSQGLTNMKMELALALVIPILEHPPNNIQKRMFKLIGLMFRVKIKESRLYLKAFMILIFGPNIVYSIRRMKAK